MKDLITTKELCEKLRVSLRTLARMRANGMPCIKMSNKMVRYDLDEVMKWIKGRDEEQTGAGAE